MASTKGVVILEDVQGKRSKMTFDGIQDMAKLKTFANTLSNRTYAKVVQVSFITTESVSIGSVQAGQFDSVDHKARVTLIAKKNNGRSATHRVPAPLDALFEHFQKSGYIVKKAQGDALAQDLNIACGRTAPEELYVFSKGKFDGDPTKSQL